MSTRGGLFILFLMSGFLGQEPEGLPHGHAPGRLPVKEITVFKDGHAFVVHEGKQAVDAQGRVRLDTLPTPVLGTFWASSREARARLRSVTAGRQTVRVERTALTIPDLLEANIGKAVVISEGSQKYDATVLGFLTRTSAELEATSPSTVTSFSPQRSNLVLLKTSEGVKVTPVEQITQLRFPDGYTTKLAVDEERNLLTLNLDWNDGLRSETADVGLAYVQRGVRWIPSYRVELEDNGKARVRLQATVLNELTDLENATVHLVVGVPTFEFKETTDPIALGQTLASLSPYFEQGSSTTLSLSNSIMTQQTMRMREVRAPAEAPRAAVDLGPDVANSGGSEDLYVFTIHNVSLKRGERMVVPVTEQVLDSEDVYVLEIPATPPRDVQADLNNERQLEIRRLLNAPKATHRIRLTNTSRQPLTTAPALLIRDGRVLSQSLMTYTSPGGVSDITVTTAVDIKVLKTERELKRTPGAAEWRGTALQKIELEGVLTLTNLRQQPARLEIRRNVLGNVGAATEDGQAEMINALEDEDLTARPAWWSWYHWPGWWSYYNGVGRFRWTVTLPPGKQVELKYTWHHFAP